MSKTLLFIFENNFALTIGLENIQTVLYETSIMHENVYSTTKEMSGCSNFCNLKNI